MTAILIVLEVSRIVLYIAEWLMSVVVWGATGKQYHFHLCKPSTKLSTVLRKTESNSNTFPGLFRALGHSTHLFAADKLDNNGYCYFGKQTTCGAIVFFGVISTLTLSAVIANHVFSHLSWKYVTRRRYEILAFVGLTVGWAAIALVSAVGNPTFNPNSTGKLVLAFSWINVLTHALSAGVAFIESRVAQPEGDD